jgi:hypothetical protein
MQRKDSFSQQEINNKIQDLRLRLNQAYKEYGHTDQVVEINQELDRYIVLAQRYLMGR